MGRGSSRHRALKERLEHQAELSGTTISGVTSEQHLQAFREGRSGVTAIEYGLIAALVAVGLIVGATALGKGLNTQFTSLGGRMKG